MVRARQCAVLSRSQKLRGQSHILQRVVDFGPSRVVGAGDEGFPGSRLLPQPLPPLHLLLKLGWPRAWLPGQGLPSPRGRCPGEETGSGRPSLPTLLTAGAKLFAEGHSFQRGPHPPLGCTSLSRTGMRALGCTSASWDHSGKGQSPSRVCIQRLQRAPLGSFPPLTHRGGRRGDRCLPEQGPGGMARSLAALVGPQPQLL